jgi:proline dehydrogenase
MTQPRRKTPVPFPGCPHTSDLDVLYDDAPTPGLSPEEKASLRVFHSELRRIGKLAQERGVKLIIDAEYR